MKTIDLNKVMQVYSGKIGECCCGCSGTYKVASAFRKEADKNRGCPHDDEDISDKSVRTIVGKIERATINGVSPMIEYDFVSVDVGNRIYTAYFVPDKA